MSARPLSRALSRALPRALPRAAVVAVAGLCALLLGTSPAGAVPGLTIALDPPLVAVFLLPTENVDPDAVLGDGTDDEVDDWFTPVDVEWGGSLVVQLPAGIDGSDATWVLETGSETDGEPTRTFSTDADGADHDGADHLDVADRGAGAYEVALPADDGTSGPVGLLTADGLTGTDEGVEVVASLYYLLGFTGSGSSAVTVAPQLAALSAVPCAVFSTEECPPYQVTAGQTIDLTVPASSPLRSLGLAGFDDTLVGLDRLDGYDDGVDDGSGGAYDEEYGQGYADGYDEGYAEEFDGTGYGDAYWEGYGAGYADEGTGYDAGHAAGLVDGRAAGALDAAAAPDADGPASAAEGLADVLSVPPATDLTPAAAMARVAELVDAVDEATDLAAAAAEPAAEPAADPATGPAGASDPVADEVAADPGSATAVTTEASVSDGVWLAAESSLPLTRTATGAAVTLPADTVPGRYLLSLIDGTGGAGPSSTVLLELEVAAAPAVAAAATPTVAPVLDRGLRSETGWTVQAAAPGPSPLVALGGGMVLLAGVGAAALTRPRRRAREE